jgi:tRNA/rRNA methyltransferase
MLNFGLRELRLVEPQCDHLSDAAKARASGSEAILEHAKVYTTIVEATADLKLTFAASARIRGATYRLMTPRAMAEKIVVHAVENPLQPECGIIFGPESTGLLSSDVEYVDGLVQIPSNPNFASLALPQSVNVCAYEYYLAAERLLRTRAFPDETIIEDEDINSSSASSLGLCLY